MIARMGASARSCTSDIVTRAQYVACYKQTTLPILSTMLQRKCIKISRLKQIYRDRWKEVEDVVSAMMADDPRERLDVVNLSQAT